MSGEPAGVAVCIPARGDWRPLDRALTAIDRVNWPRYRLHVVVAVDGPDERLETCARRHGAAVVVANHPRGSYAARNLALDQLPSWVDYVLFTDADCIPREQWVSAHVAALSDCDLSGGAIDVTVRETPSPAEYIDKVRHLHQEAYVKRDGYAATANLGVSKPVAGLRFDATLVSGGDAEFCQRAVAAGYRLRYTPTAVVEHPARRSSREVLAKVRRLAWGIRSRPAPWSNRPVPRVRLPHYLLRRAHLDGASQGLWWDVRAGLLSVAADTVVMLAVLSAKRRSQPETG